MEESLAQHYAILKRYLAQSLRDEKGNPKPNRARDKLLRLSPVQFQELSTDVYDELLRRQSAGGPQANGPGQVPTYLLPKESFHPKRNQARQKLATLPPPRFRDLATDVFYELERRFPRFAGGEIDRNESPAPNAIGPPSRQGTPNGIRPGSREPGSMRQPPGPTGGFTPRKGSLGGQALAGLTIPGAGAQDDAYGRPTAKTSQSNTIIPNKSTLVEDDDDPTGPEDNEDRRSDAFGSRRDTSTTFRSVSAAEKSPRSTAQSENRVSELESKVNELETLLRDKDMALRKLHETHLDKEKAITTERGQWTDLRSDLEGKLRDALKLNNNLHSELGKVRASHASTERELKSQKAQSTRQQDEGENDWRMRFENLDRAHQALQTELRQQQNVTNEVKHDATAFLEEMRALSAQSTRSYEREENLMYQVHRREDQIKEWKNRYARAKTQLRNLRASSLGLSLQQPDTTQLRGFTDQDGLIKGLHITRYQIAIDELLRAARGNEPASVLPHVKSVVVAVRNISQDVGNVSLNDDEQSQQKSKLRSKISATANNLITASRNFAISDGLSPVSLLDAAASHLTAAVVNLIRVVKIQPTSPTELEDDDDSSFIAESPAYYGIQFDRSSGGGESVNSVYSSPQPPPSKANSQGQPAYPTRKLSSRDGPPHVAQNGSAPVVGLGLRAHDSEIEELKTFLLDQKETLLQSIQSLVGSVRANDKPAAIRESINDIAAIVGKVIGETQHGISDTENAALRERLDPIVRSLTESRSKLMNASAEGESVTDPEWKEFANTLPPLTFPVAKQMTELVQSLGHVESVEGHDDDFR